MSILKAAITAVANIRGLREMTSWQRQARSSAVAADSPITGDTIKEANTSDEANSWGEEVASVEDLEEQAKGETDGAAPTVSGNKNNPWDYTPMLRHPHLIHQLYLLRLSIPSPPLQRYAVFYLQSGE
ncbi:hypothetical protein FRC04_004141 [Tulasnella sp. 424]|nr:hypothetical protein FRC04_004141 [Tulasnella sp. 424]KAG8964214.1 hypothetical protein FRC05_003871 [Tulasnella sp. 425]